MNFEQVLRQHKLLPPQPKVIPMGTDHRFDVDGELIDIILDENDLFHKKELSSIKCFNRILSGKTEFKAEDKTLKTLFIEYQIDKKGNGQFIPSGLSISEAGIWRINIKRLVIEVDINFLRFCFDYKDKFGFQYRDSETDDNHIGRGFLIPMSNLLNYHNVWEDYEAGEDLDICLAKYFNPDEYRRLIHKKLFPK